MIRRAIGAVFAVTRVEPSLSFDNGLCMRRASADEYLSSHDLPLLLVERFPTSVKLPLRLRGLALTDW